MTAQWVSMQNYDICSSSCTYFSAAGPGLMSAIMGCTQTRTVIMIPSTEWATSACGLIKI